MLRQPLALGMVAALGCGRIEFEVLAHVDATSGMGSPFSLRLGQTGQGYVVLGNPSVLHLDTFTIEMMVRREGVGETSSSGNLPGALQNIAPLITKGRGQVDGDETLDINYFLGLSMDMGFALAHDFEEGAAGPAPSSNHPVIASTQIGVGAWHHVAVTYDGMTVRLYVDGVLDAMLPLGLPIPPASASVVNAVIGGASNSTGDVNGAFDGFVDELRVWGRARTDAEIDANRHRTITSDPDLRSRFAFDEGSGLTTVDSVGGVVGQLLPSGGGFEWASGAPLD